MPERRLLACRMREALLLTQTTRQILEDMDDRAYITLRWATLKDALPKLREVAALLEGPVEELEELAGGRVVQIEEARYDWIAREVED